MYTPKPEGRRAEGWGCTYQEEPRNVFLESGRHQICNPLDSFDLRCESVTFYICSRDYLYSLFKFAILEAMWLYTYVVVYYYTYIHYNYVIIFVFQQRWTGLHYAAYNNKLQSIKKLVELDADITITDAVSYSYSSCYYYNEYLYNYIHSLAT